MIRWLYAALTVLAVLLAGGVLWLRLVPVSVDAYHRMGTAPHAEGDWRDGDGFEAVRQVPAPGAKLQELVRIAGATPRTTLLEGAAEEGLVTFVSRSAVLGLPEITNLWIDGNRIHLRGQVAMNILGLGLETPQTEQRIRLWMSRAGLQ